MGEVVFMKKEPRQAEELRPRDNHMTMSTQHGDRFATPQVKS